RRHTRFSRDWSSDVCSSDLEHMLASAQDHGGRMLVYVTPERFENEEFLADLRRVRVGLFVVDEAHSISEWGHTFRPSYLTLNARSEERRVGKEWRGRWVGRA